MSSAEGNPGARGDPFAGAWADVEVAGRRCEELTRERARNFWYGIRLLPREQRLALCAVYAFARRVDDVGDGPLPPDQKLAALDALARSLALVAGDGRDAEDQVVVALAAAARRYALPLTAFDDLIAGVRGDVVGAPIESYGDLVLYCRRVAGSIGRLSLAVFTIRAPAWRPAPRLDSLADDLGVALQLTNILRDVREDLAAGRVYLPAADLRRFGVEPGVLAGPPSDAVVALLRAEAERASWWFDRGLRLTAYLEPRSAACVTAMAGIYRELLRRIVAEPACVLSERVSLPLWRKGMIAARALVRAAA